MFIKYYYTFHKSVISEQGQMNEQGQIQGALASLMSASGIIGSLIMSYLFYYFTHSDAPFQFSGSPFVFGGILMLLSAVLAYFSFKA